MAVSVNVDLFTENKTLFSENIGFKVKTLCFAKKIHCYKSAWSFTHTFTSNNNTCGILSKMNQRRLLILINTSYTTNY